MDLWAICKEDRLFVYKTSIKNQWWCIKLTKLLQDVYISNDYGTKVTPSLHVNLKLLNTYMYVYIHTSSNSKMDVWNVNIQEN